MSDVFAIDQKTVEQLVFRAVQDNILSAVEHLSQDPAWLSKIEQLVAQTVTYQTLAKISSIDISEVIRGRVDENMDSFHNKMREDFSSIGIKDQATETQLTIMDDHTVFENNLTARDLTIANSADIQNLVVRGSINTDNQSWKALSADITEKTLASLTEEWRDTLVDQTAERIKKQGINFDRVTVDGEPLVTNGRLSNGITASSLQTVGVLQNLRVSGEAHLCNTVNVINRRLGINTEEPETALSVWDEEVAVNIGKVKQNQAYIGTGRAQGLSIGTNRIPQIEIDADGMTQIKRLRVGVHQISHADQVPGWSGTRGDIVFNSNPTDSVFAWVCLGNFKWKPLKSAE